MALPSGGEDPGGRAMRELLMALGSCALVIYIVPAVIALVVVIGLTWKFKPWKGGGR